MLDKAAEKSAASIRKRLATFKRHQQQTSEAIQRLQTECQHHTAHYKYCGSSGNYDPASDGYWIEWHCPDCDKRWTTDQTYAEVQRYPNAIKVSR